MGCITFYNSIKSEFQTALSVLETLERQQDKFLEELQNIPKRNRKRKEGEHHALHQNSKSEKRGHGRKKREEIGRLNSKRKEMYINQV